MEAYCTLPPPCSASPHIKHPQFINSSQRENLNKSRTIKTSSQVSPISRTESESVSTIRNFVFGGDKKFSSLSHHWRKKSSNSDVSNPKKDEAPTTKFKSATFRSPGTKNSFFHYLKSYSHSNGQEKTKPDALYGSTPNLTLSQTFPRSPFKKIVKELSSDSNRPSVKKIVQELEGSAVKEPHVVQECPEVPQSRGESLVKSASFQCDPGPRKKNGRDPISREESLNKRPRRKELGSVSFNPSPPTETMVIADQTGFNRASRFSNIRKVQRISESRISAGKVGKAYSGSESHSIKTGKVDQIVCALQSNSGVSAPDSAAIASPDSSVSQEPSLSNGGPSVHLEDPLLVSSISTSATVKSLARWGPIEDLSAKGGQDPQAATNEVDGDTRATERQKTTASERRESGRFHSAARLIRSLGKSKDGEVSSKENSDACLSRSNPQYHSEGKGPKKKSSDKPLSSSSHKERSKSFCDKPEARHKVTQHLRQKNSFRKPKSQSSSSLRAAIKSSPESNQLKGSIPPKASSPKKRSPSKLLENGVSAVQEHPKDIPPVPDTTRVNQPITESPAPSLERDKDRRSLRKLTKDSGYETSPYSEGDYALLETYCSSELEALAAEVARESDEATIRADSELSSLETLIPQHSRSGSLSGETANQIQRDLRCAPVGSPCHLLPPAKPDKCEENASGARVPLEAPPPEEPLSPENPRPSSPSTKPQDKRRLSSDSLITFAESLLLRPPSPSPPPSAFLLPAKSTPDLCQHDGLSASFSSPSDRGASCPQSEHPSLAPAPLLASKSTPNLDDVTSDQMMVMRPSNMHPFIHGPPPSPPKQRSGDSKSAFWDLSPLHKDKYEHSDYAHHIRSSSYHMMQGRQPPRNAYHHRQHSNTSNYSEGDEPSPKSSRLDSFTNRRSPFSIENSRCFSFENVVPQPISNIDQPNWNTSEPDLNFINSYYSSNEGIPFGTKEVLDSPKHCPTSPTPSASSRRKNSPPKRVSGSPPAPPVRDASSLKYIRYGPGHEKYPSWPVPAGVAHQVIPNVQSSLGANTSGLPDGSYLTPPQGSHRSHSWTEQSDYPKDKSGGYTRPHHRKSPSQKHLTVMEKYDKIHPFGSRFSEDVLQSPDYSMMDDYLNQSSVYYPPYDREGRGIDDKDYSIPSPPERDPGMGEANLSLTPAQLEEHARQYEFGYGEFPQITPLLDQLRQESYMWDGDSEKDSGRGESESVAESSRFSNGRESVTTVVTNSSSASSSETLKWHGSMSDISSLSGISRDLRLDHNIVHSSKVLAPQRHNSESVLYYSSDGKKTHPKFNEPAKHLRDSSRHNSGTGNDMSRYAKDPRWSREGDRKTEMSNLKKFPSYSYTQPLSQINEAPVAESSVETTHSPEVRSIKSPVIDFTKPLSVAERISEIERQSRSSSSEMTARWPRDLSEPRNMRSSREEFRIRDPSLGREAVFRKEFHRNNSEKDLSLTSLEPKSDLKLNGSPIRESFNNILNNSGRGASLTSNKSFASSPSSVFSRSPHKDFGNDSMLSVDSSHSVVSSFSETDRFAPNSRSYTYLDPEKKCMVPDSTLKSIQKQAILSFYERRTGKNAGSPSHVQDLGVPVSKAVSPPPSRDALGQSIRGRPERVPCKGVARLGRVPDAELVSQQIQPLPSRPIRRKSVNGREVPKEVSLRSSLSSNSPTRIDQPPLPPLKSQKVPGSNKLEGGSPGGQLALHEERKHSDHSYQRSCPEVSSLSPESRFTSSNSLPFTPLSVPSTAPALPPPPSTEEVPPKPPDRPPKRPSLRSLFHNSRNDISSTSVPSPEKLSPESLEIRRIEQSADELRNLTAPAKPSFYRKPPAPDPPESPPIQNSVPGVNHCPEVPVPAISEPLSRSSTPELPPPPPPLSEDIFSDDPLPPPPSDVSSALPPQHDGNYHKDSYVAHRKDLKTGFEGRYRRTHSPSAPHQRLHSGPHNPCNKPKNHNNNNTNTYLTSNSNSHLSNSFYPATSIQQNGMLRSAYSTSNIIHPPSSVLDNDPPTLKNNINTVTNGSTNEFSAPVGQHNGWAAHPRQTSTTVDFTADELRALKAKRAVPEMILSSNTDREFLAPKGGTVASSPRDPIGGSMCSLNTEGSSSSASSSSVPYSDSLPLQMGSFWTTSLDCLHRTSPDSQPKSNSFSSPPGRSMARAISIGEPLCTMADSSQERLPRLVAVSDDNSLSRSTSVSESLSLSCTGAEVSRSNSINSEFLSSPYIVDSSTVPSSPGVIPHDGPITAHPATVTEESQPSSPCSSKGSEDDPLLPNSLPSTPPRQPLNLAESQTNLSTVSTELPASPNLSLAASQPDVVPIMSSSLATSPQSTAPCQVASSTISYSLNSSNVLNSSSSTSSISSGSNSSIITYPSSMPASKIPYKRTLSASGTCPAMTTLDSSDANFERENIVVLGYGRTKSREEIDCDNLSNEFAQRLGLETRLQALLAHVDVQKTAGHYMTGVFNLELRSDLLRGCHASHPDLQRQSASSVVSPSPTGGSTSSASSKEDASDSGLGLKASLENKDSKVKRTDESIGFQVSGTRLPSSENKVMSMARQINTGVLGSSPLGETLQLRKKKDELLLSITRKLDALNKERECIKEEISQNNEMGKEVSTKLEGKAKAAEVDKIKTHIGEIDKITSLLLSLACRLAKVENSLTLSLQGVITEDKEILEGKRDKLKEQMEEAKKLKESIDRRAIQVSNILSQYLTEEEYAQYDHFIKMKAKLLMDARETQDKIAFAEDQLEAVRKDLPNS